MLNTTTNGGFIISEEAMKAIQTIGDEEIPLTASMKYVGNQRMVVIDISKDAEKMEIERYRPIVEKLLAEDKNLTAEDIAAGALCLADKTQRNTYRPPRVSAPRFQQHEEGTFENSGAQPGMVRFWIGVGKMSRVRPSDIVGTIAGECNIPGSAIGRIDIFDKFSFVEVPEEYAEQVRNILRTKTIRGRPTYIRVATPNTQRERIEYPIEEGTFENSGAEEGYVRFRISLGKRDWIRPNDIVGTIAGECNISGSAIGKILIFPTCTLVDIPRENAETIKPMLEGKNIHGKTFKVTIATPFKSTESRTNDFEDFEDSNESISDLL